MDPSTPTTSSTVPSQEELLYAHGKDVLSRTAKTFVAVYLAFVTAGGLNLLHASTAKEVTLGGLAAIITAVWNVGIKAWNLRAK